MFNQSYFNLVLLTKF